MIRELQGKLTTDQAADYLGLVVRTLANWRSEGRGPAYTRFRGRVYYDKYDLDNYLKEELSVRNTKRQAK